MKFFLPSDFGPPYGTEFIPDLQYITNITNGQLAVVTFPTIHRFTIGEWVSFRVPPPYGMIQLNNQKGLVVRLTPYSITIDVDTTHFYPFIYVTDQQIPCVAVPAGSGIIPGTATVTLEDAFDNRPFI